jgi:hypothetical protein
MSLVNFGWLLLQQKKRTHSNCIQSKQAKLTDANKPSWGKKQAKKISLILKTSALHLHHVVFK